MEEADEIIVEEIVIDSIIDKIAGGEAIHDKIAEGVAKLLVEPPIETVIDKIAGGGAANDNTAGERVEELTIDPSVELAVLEAVQRVDEEADEIIIDKIARSEAVLDKIAGGEAVHDKIARDEAVHDNTAGE